jgi:hypothetical protein
MVNWINCPNVEAFPAGTLSWKAEPLLNPLA